MTINFLEHQSLIANDNAFRSILNKKLSLQKYSCYNSYLQDYKMVAHIARKKQQYGLSVCGDPDLEPRHIPCHTDCMLPVNQDIENVRALLH